jgi:hypothetical protein
MPRPGRRRRRRSRKDRRREGKVGDDADPHEVAGGGFRVFQDGAADATAWVLGVFTAPRQEIWIFYKLDSTGGFQRPSATVTPSDLEYEYVGPASMADPVPCAPVPSSMLQWVMSETGDYDTEHYTVELFQIV